MRWRLCVFVACHLLVPPLYAQWLEKPLLPCGCRYALFSSAIAPLHPADILHYRLSLSLSMRDNFLQGSNQIRFRSIVPALRRLSLSAAQMTIDSITLQPNHERLRFSHQGDSLHIDLPSPLALNDSATLTIYYHATPNRRGYYFYTAAESGAEPIAYTLSQPYDARYWMPCYDEPYDKATADISITVPSGFIAASIGRLVRVEHIGNFTRYHWSTHFPVATYLMCITVSRYCILKDFLPPTSERDTLPIEHYVWRQDSLQALGYFRNVKRMIEVCESVYGIAYPFEKYGQAAVRPFSVGGMEHQTLTTLNQALLFNENLIMHELAHQWWGDMVTCETWRDLWLNEGFATYSEALWQEALGGATALRRYMRARIRPRNWTTPIYNASPLFSDVVYGKAAWVLHMLRKQMGDTLFRELLKRYGMRYQFANVRTADFQRVAEEVYGNSLEWFFEQWIFRTGIPKLEYGWSKSQRTNGWELRIHIRQIQPEPPFILNMDIQVYSASKKEVFSRTMQSHDSTFVFLLDEEPTSVFLDEDEWILKESLNLTDIAERSKLGLSFRLEQNYPNPFNPTTTIRYELPVSAFTTLQIFDVLGREVQTLVHARQEAGRYTINFDARHLPSGIYFYRLQSGKFSETKKMTLLK
jgi:aminopeptidase N